MEQKRPADIFAEALYYLWNGLGLEEKGWKRLKKGDFKKKTKNGLTYQIWFDRSRYNYIDYPAFLVDKVKDELQKVIDLLESGETNTEVIQKTLDEAVCGINDLQEEFDENDSEIETVARECIAATVAYILEWFNIPIDTEEAIRERDW